MCFKSSGETNTVSKYEPPEWTRTRQHNWYDYVDRAGEIADRMATHPDEYVYQGPRVAPLVQEQIDAVAGLRQDAMFDPNKAQRDASLGWMLQGGAQHGDVGSNIFGGNSNPQFEAMLAAQNKNMADTFARGTGAQTDAAAARAGAFGGSGHTEQQAANARSLADAVAQSEATARSGQYDRAAQLYENELQRGFGAREADLGRIQSSIGMFTPAQQGDMALWQALLGAGEMSRSLDQQQLGANRDWFNEMSQMPLVAADYYGSMLTRAGGGAGTTTSQMLGGNSPWQMAAGGGLLGAGLYNMFRG